MVFAHSIAGFIFLFGISGGEILILLLLVLILFGPSKIPEIARMLGRGLNEVKKVQREINTEIHRYSSEIEKETSKMQSEIDDIKKQVAQNKEPRPDPYEEARANAPDKQPEREGEGEADTEKTGQQAVSPEQDRADKIRESMGDPSVEGEKEQKQKQDQEQEQEQDQPRPEDEDLPYPYNKKENRDSVD